MEINSSGSLFILDNQDLWASNNQGTTFTKINDDFNVADSKEGMKVSKI
jgi:hypothetical protein